MAEVTGETSAAAPAPPAPPAGDATAPAAEAPRAAERAPLHSYDFDLLEELGEGNFTRVFRAVYKPSGGVYALKVIEKENVTRMKRRHPNIHNEIRMEKRVLAKVGGHRRIVQLYGTFQDASSLYYHMEFCRGGLVWDALHVRDKMVGFAPSRAKRLAAELVEALLFLHKRGIVHRDIKTENMMLTEGGHLKLIDFGTSKDLVETDLNGPEFVGTAEFMSPEAVMGGEADHRADLWALGCVIFQLLAGYPPLKSQSPYIAFLKIRNPETPLFFPDFFTPDVIDLVRSLLRFSAEDRLGDLRTDYADLRGHAYFEGVPIALPDAEDAVGPMAAAAAVAQEADVEEATAQEAHVLQIALDLVGPTQPATSAAGGDAQLDEVALRQQAVEQLHALDDPRDVARVRHIVNRLGRWHDPKVSRPFYSSLIDARCLRADVATREYMGLSWDEHGDWKEPFAFMQIADPQLGIICGDNSVWDVELERLKQAVSAVNRMRPKFLLVAGDLTNAKPGEPFYEEQLADFRKAMARVSETIPVLYVCGNHDCGDHVTREAIAAYQRAFGAEYYGAWFGGTRVLVVNSGYFMHSELCPELAEEQERWFDQELRLAKLCAQHVIVVTHHPWCARNVHEDAESGGIEWFIPLETRMHWLQLMRHRKVRLALSGHLHRNASLRNPLKRVPVPDSKALRKQRRRRMKLRRKRADEVEAAVAASGGSVAPGKEDAPGGAANADDGADGSGGEEDDEIKEGEEVADTDDDDDDDDEDEDVDEALLDEPDPSCHGPRIVTTTSCGSALEGEEGVTLFKVYHESVEHEFLTLSEVPRRIELRAEKGPADDKPLVMI